jgi:hypothetical protein
MENLIPTHLIPSHFAPTSRIWIYQSSRPFTSEESVQIQKSIDEFISGWTAHGAAVKGIGLIVFNQFILLVADESRTQVSGCSTDSSVHFIQQLQQAWNTDFFNRRTLAVWIQDKVHLFDMGDIPKAMENQSIDAETLYFNNLVGTLQDWRNHWIQPIKNSWIAQKYPGIFSATSPV